MGEYAFADGEEVDVSGIAKGDADGNGRLEAADCAMVLQKTLISTFRTGIEKMTDDYMDYLDINSNGNVDADDAARILQTVLQGGSFDNTK